MRKLVLSLSAIGILMGSFYMPSTFAADAGAEAIAEGKKLSFNRKKGNCLACHIMDDGVAPGNIGPPLVAMKARFPDKAVLRAQIFDARTKNPNTVMPPFGAHGALSESEVDKVTEYVHTL
jgi:sulfur-oxidizing protein SoxX